MPGGVGVRGGAMLVAALTLVVSACSGSPAEESAGSASTSPSAPETLDATAAVRERCASAIPEEADLEAFELTGATGGDIEAARIGPARNDRVAILLPQIGGMCGWGRWATAAQEAGITSILLNPCGYGESVCDADADADPLNEVAPAVRLAREEAGARRVVLLGTSMGGSLTVFAAAAGADVDAWADVSGPSSWDGVDLMSVADRLPAGGLVVMAPSDGAAAFDDARALARRAGVRFVAGRNGHGWELLVDPLDGSITRIGERLVALAQGPGGG